VWPIEPCKFDHLVLTSSISDGIVQSKSALSWGFCSSVECQPSKHKALSSYSSTPVVHQKVAYGMLTVEILQSS
jgi:hypothetical protein